ncbi:histidinol phosphatase-like enzyme [Metabacillus niabensis]|uniref:Histidinol phosphatase-like enzyme n=1 Tax=Metabacillus niabensis TaxID=324854 RepID=A0ABT9Z6V7_9BACI|nr:histidinol phosphatase-like enzyme [Metabacillus niabensis]
MKNQRKIEAIFLDRDGTIGGDDTVHYPGSFQLYPHSRELINKLKEDGIKVFSLTNQPGISEEKQLRKILWMNSLNLVLMIYFFVHIVIVKGVYAENLILECL